MANSYGLAHFLFALTVIVTQFVTLRFAVSFEMCAGNSCHAFRMLVMHGTPKSYLRDILHGGRVIVVVVVVVAAYFAALRKQFMHFPYVSVHIVSVAFHRPCF
jgi:hydrogenase-4 membrane subunit HyfE